MVSYIRGPAYKSVKSIAGLNLPLIRKYTPNLIFWGSAGIGAVATFTEGIPLFKNTFYSKIPFFGEHWIHNPDPEDVPV